jgi:hypothetical protein
MHYTIYVLEQTISDLEPYRDDDDGTVEQIKELKEAIAILERHAAAKVSAGPIKNHDFAIHKLEAVISDLLNGPQDKLLEPIAELVDAIKIIENHNAKTPTAPPEFVRDYPHASD